MKFILCYEQKRNSIFQPKKKEYIPTLYDAKEAKKKKQNKQTWSLDFRHFWINTKWGTEFVALTKWEENLSPSISISCEIAGIELFAKMEKKLN